jgi:hypothetical protein
MRFSYAGTSYFIGDKIWYIHSCLFTAPGNNGRIFKVVDTKADSLSYMTMDHSDTFLVKYYSMDSSWHTVNDHWFAYLNKDIIQQRFFKEVKTESILSN